ncbi:MAG: tetratricopeptide repeat protein [bacterium]
MLLIQFSLTLLIITFILVILIFLVKLLHEKYTSYQLLKKALADPEFLEQLNDPEELRRLARRLGSVGQLKKSLLAWDRYLKLVESSAEAWMERGKIFYKRQKYVKALEELKKADSCGEEGYPEIDLYFGRCFREKGNINKSLEAYLRYLDNVPENLNIGFEIADTARKGQKIDKAREVYNRVRDKGVRRLYIMATLELVEMELDHGNIDEATEYLKQIYNLDRQGKLSENEELEIRYQHARLLEKKGELEEALRLYQHIYKIQPEYRDVSQSIEDYIEDMGDQELLADYLNSDRREFIEISRKIIELMGNRPPEKFQFSEEEDGIVASESSGMMAEEIIYEFKKWDYPVSEWPLREFELKVIEKNVEKGYFVSPGGFKPGAIKFAGGKEKINLIGPEELINYLPDAMKENFK